VRLEVTEEISDVTGQQPLGTLGVVPFAKRTAQTQLVVKDQQTVVIGGLMRTRVARTDTKIPLLGDIPVLGALFRSRSSELQRSNLILVLTPYIIREQSDLRGVFERKMQERQEFLDHYFVFSDQTAYEPPKDYKRTNGLLEDIRQSFLDVAEAQRLEDLKRPREIRVHEPGQPLELPTPIGAPGTTAGAEPPKAGGDGKVEPKGNAPAAPALNVAPTPRSIERIER
jgi:general secretion pathway protein D